MDSLLFAKGPQMGNKMFVQLFNVKNIHFGAQTLCLVWVRLSRQRVGAVTGGKWLVLEMSVTLTAELGHELVRALVTGMLLVNAGKQLLSPAVPVATSGP